MARIVVSTFEALEVRAAAELGLAGPPGIATQRGHPPGLRCVRMADVRYQGQAHQVVVTVPPGPLDDQALDRIAGAFLEQYKEICDASGQPHPPRS